VKVGCLINFFIPCLVFVIERIEKRTVYDIIFCNNNRPLQHLFQNLHGKTNAIFLYTIIGYN